GSPATSTASRATRATASCATCMSTWPTRCSSAASAGARTRSRSGTIAASSTTRCGIIGRTPAPATGSPSRATARCKEELNRRRAGGAQRNPPERCQKWRVTLRSTHPTCCFSPNPSAARASAPPRLQGRAGVGLPALLLHDLLLRGLGEMVELEADLRRGAALALGVEVGAHLLDDFGVAALEFGLDDLA